MNMGFTEYGLKIISESKEYGLDDFLDAYMGNFGFTEDELFRNMNKILMWLENHNSYVLLYQYHEEYEGRNWWLTENYD